MGIMVGLPSPSGSEKDLQLNFGKNMTVQVEMRSSSPACRMASAKRHTVDMAACRYRLGIYAERSTRMFCQYSQRNSQT